MLEGLQVIDVKMRTVIQIVLSVKYCTAWLRKIIGSTSMEATVGQVAVCEISQ
jgi:hypothetical protein